MKNDTQITFKCTEDFKKRLEKQAEKEQRPVSNLIKKIITEYLNAHDY